ncbi:MAG: hypothetical protein DMG73_20420 [Acidobacteria bacterium]|nr:MAG: hypothetical protein DMG73_20420 [Acidobacteriota bacterium]
MDAVAIGEYLGVFRRDDSAERRTLQRRGIHVVDSPPNHTGFQGKGDPGRTAYGARRRIRRCLGGHAGNLRGNNDQGESGHFQAHDVFSSNKRMMCFPPKKSIFHSSIRMLRAIPSGPTRTSANMTPFGSVEAGVRPATREDGSWTRIISIAPTQLSSSQYMRPLNPSGSELPTFVGELAGRLRLAKTPSGFVRLGLCAVTVAWLLSGG